MDLIPKHRALIDELILKSIIDSYAISGEAGRGWIIINANNKKEAKNHLMKSPIAKYFFDIEIEQLLVYDSQLYRFPKIMMN
jgi:hypothetical protein